MRLLIVNLHLEIGGVETLLARLIPLLSSAGIDITLLLLQNKTDAELLKAVSNHCKVIYLKDTFPYSKKKIRQILGQEFDLAFYTISRALLVGSWLLTRAGYTSTKACLGAYQTEIFCPETSLFSFHHKILRNIVRHDIPAGAMIFGNTAGRDFHADRLGMDLQEAQVIRLFVDTRKYTCIDRTNLPRKKIVSIGRVTSFKTYNFTFLPVLKKLIDQGRDLEWHIYGDGEQLEELRAAISDNGLADRVFAHGAMRYSDFENVLQDAFLFLGSGTSLIEAAACGVPSLTTIEYARDAVTYGFISEIAGDNLIEPNSGRQNFLIESKLVEILEAPTTWYSELQRLCAQKSNTYSGENIINDYVIFFKKSREKGRSVRISTSQLFFCTIGFFLTKLVGKR